MSGITLDIALPIRSIVVQREQTTDTFCLILDPKELFKYPLPCFSCPLVLVVLGCCEAMSGITLDIALPIRSIVLQREKTTDAFLPHLQI